MRVRVLGSLLLLSLSSCRPEGEPGCVEVEPGCGGDGYAVPEPGCYVPCDGPDAACGEGTCTEAWINPCAGSACAACGGSEWLCL